MAEMLSFEILIDSDRIFNVRCICFVVLFDDVIVHLYLKMR